MSYLSYNSAVDYFSIIAYVKGFYSSYTTSTDNTVSVYATFYPFLFTCNIVK